VYKVFFKASMSKQGVDVLFEDIILASLSLLLL
jgi:hypothetical protein